MKKKLLLLLSIVLVCAVCLFACGVAPLSAGPANSDSILGNGGLAVVKGDYLYFANAYYDYNSLKEGENKYDFNNTQKLYGIYRVKLNQNGIVDLDKDGFPTGAELMVPQVAGYSYSGLYIFGDYLYYTTPFTGNKSGELVKGLITFERVNLNRTGHKVLHTMTTYSSSCKYNINYIDGSVYITIFDNDSNLVVVRDKGGDNVQTKTLSTKVENLCVFEQNSDVNTQLNSVNKYAYYTRKVDDVTTLYRKSLVDFNLAEEGLRVSQKDLKPVSVKNNRVYFLEDNILKSSSFDSEESSSLVTTYSSLSVKSDSSTDTENTIISYYILDDTYGGGYDRGIMAVVYDGSEYVVKNYTPTGSEVVFENAKQQSILYVKGSKIYYKLADDEALYCFNDNTEQDFVVANKFNTTTKDDETNVYDFDSNRAYYFDVISDSNEVKYLHLVELSASGYTDENDNPVGHYIGVEDASKIY